VAQPLVARPHPCFPPSLVGHALAKTRYPAVVGDDHPALARGDLLFGIEREHRAVREGAVTGLDAPVFRPQGLAGVLDHHKPVAVGDLADDVEPRRLAKGVHRKDGLRAGSDGVLDEVRVDVGGVRLDVHEHRLRPLIQGAVAGRDEAERGRDDLLWLAGAETLEKQARAPRAATI